MEREAIDPRIGERLHALRRRKGWTQERLAAQVPCSKVVVVQLERGQQRVSAERLAAFCRALECSADDVLGLPSTLARGTASC